MARCQRHDRRAQTGEDRIGLNEERAGLQFCEARESSGDLAFGTRRQDAKPHPRVLQATVLVARPVEHTSSVNEHRHAVRLARDRVLHPAELDDVKAVDHVY